MIRKAWSAMIGLLAMASVGAGADSHLGNGGFAIAAAGPAVQSEDHGAYFPPAMRFDAASGSVDVTFGLEEGARVSLHAFDAEGKLLATLLDADLPAGYHHRFVFANRLQGAGRVVFQLRSGQTVLAETRSLSN